MTFSTKLFNCVPTDLISQKYCELRGKQIVLSHPEISPTVVGIYEACHGWGDHYKMYVHHSG